MELTEKLAAIEEIKQLKARYFLGVDTKDWALWRDEVFTPDASLVPEVDYPEGFHGIDAIIDWISQAMAHNVSVHHGHMPIVEITGPETAKGIWALEDRIYSPPDHLLNGTIAYLHGFGHYHEDYVKTARGWRIRNVRITRLRAEYHPLASTPGD